MNDPSPSTSPANQWRSCAFIPPLVWYKKKARSPLNGRARILTAVYLVAEVTSPSYVITDYPMIGVIGGFFLHRLYIIHYFVIVLLAPDSCYPFSPPKSCQDEPSPNPQI
ncbi:hypothetical protein LCGC14_2779040 [marine sediment metagenome]|uniref:Uncharacterized protein n=1 Tax=marine sediment metagenome TaxID=412755 RepID=A0A0F9B2P9_9ZZZZ